MRKYDIKILDDFKKKEYMSEYLGAPIKVKAVPDVKEEGEMDPRLYRDSKKMMNMLKWLPSFMLKMEINEKSLPNLRETFNGIKSVETAVADIKREQYKVDVKGGSIDLYLYSDEKTNKNSPVLFYIHGGGFFGGSHAVVEESLKLMVEKFHFAVTSVDYRLAPENPYPASHEDTYAALKYVYENADKLGICKDKIFVAGDSAGGNLAQYCSTRCFEDGNDIVKGQLLLYPTLNMVGVRDEYFNPSMANFKMAKSQRRALTKMTGLFGKLTDGMSFVLGTSDLHNDYLNPYTRDPKNNPPTFISAGEHDFLKQESFGYGAKLYKAGIDVTMVVYNGLGHAYFDNCGVYPQCEDLIVEMGEFINSHAKQA